MGGLSAFAVGFLVRGSALDPVSGEAVLVGRQRRR